MVRIERGPSPAEAVAHGSPRLIGLLVGLGGATLTRLVSRQA